MTKKLKLRPYARLLTMLGDQLIRNERVALVEIIKNSYDADASWVKVTFDNFDENFSSNAKSKIIIEDDGCGMSSELIEKHWVNPATPTKLISKKLQPATPKGRLIQGEKGIGRFALLKLGKTIEIVTRPQRRAAEYTLKMDFSAYDENFIPEGKAPLFLDDIRVSLSESTPAKAIVKKTVGLGARKITREPHGTRITISHLSSSWNASKVEKVFQDLTRLQSIFITSDERNSKKPVDFEVVIHRNDGYIAFSDRYQEKLRETINSKAVLKIEDGRYDEEGSAFEFNLNGKSTKIPLDSSEITGLKIFRDRIEELGLKSFDRKTECGAFNFTFYVFDFSAEAGSKYHLDKEDKAIIKEHRVYLYRDGIRVYPYGDPDDDWLETDVYRGTVKASAFLSNDQVVGFVKISQSGNPALRDKTSREGLIDAGNANADFKWLLQLVLQWIRSNPFAKHLQKKKVSNDVGVFKQQEVQKAIDASLEAASAHPAIRDKVALAARLYSQERRYLVQRAEATEHLAGVGLSVETASHDLMTAMARALTVIDSLISQSGRPGQLDRDVLSADLTMLRGILSFIQTQLKDVQLLFKSTKQRRKDVRVLEILNKVQRLYQTSLVRHKIEFLVEQPGSPLVAKTTDAVLLQLLLNLFDNSVYWLEGWQEPRKILVHLDGEQGRFIFADNGPGIKAEDQAYIFEPFFSGKGEDGRGLGLYIARQLLERHGFSIELVTKSSEKLLSGANFVVSFVGEED